MGEQHFEDVQVEEAVHDLHVAARDTEMADDALVSQSDQFLDRTAFSVETLVERVLGVVQVDQRERVESEALGALLDGRRTRRAE